MNPIGAALASAWRTCPAWCAADHRCTAERLSSGEHSSPSATWRTRWGGIVATRHADCRGESIELRVSVRLPRDGVAAFAQTTRLPFAVAAAVEESLQNGGKR